MDGQGKCGVAVRRLIKEIAFSEKSDLRVLLNRIFLKGFLQTVDWEDTMQDSRGTDEHTLVLSHVCFCLLENPLKMCISPFAICCFLNYLI